MIGRIVVYTGNTIPACKSLMVKSVAVLAAIALVFGAMVLFNAGDALAVPVTFAAICFGFSAIGTLLKNAVRWFDLSRKSR